MNRDGPPDHTSQNVDASETDSLALREARYRTIFEATSTILWATDVEGNFTAGQAEWSRWTGQAREAQKALGWTDAIHPDDRGPFVRAFAEAREAQRTLVAEARVFSAAHQEHRECELRAAPLLHEDGSLREWVGHLMDIADMRRAEATAQEREAMLEALFENVPVPIFFKDRQGRYMLGSREFRSLLLEDPNEDYVGKTDDDLLPWQVARDVRAHDEEVFQSGETRVFEEMVPGADGEDRWWLVTKFPIPGPIGSSSRSLAGIAIDVTERMRLAEERSEAIRRRDDFLAMLSHELRNPMQAILHAVRMVDAENADTSRDAKAIIRRQAHHVSRMLGDLLDVSRMVHGRINLTKERVLVERVVDAAVETVRPLALEAEVKIAKEIESARVRGDETRLVQVLVNLLRNAVSHSEPGSTVRVRSRVEGEEVLFEVADEGTGIDPEDLERIFDPFFQREQSIARTEGGLGLGLSLGRTLVQLHGGSLEARSGGRGAGACFTMRLPFDGAPTSTSRVPPAPAPDAPVEKLRFVVVEDNDDSREMLVLWLRSRGHEVVACEDGDSGLAAILEERPDLAIVDIGLPGLSGYEIAERVRDAWEGPPLKMVAVTGYGRPEDRTRVFEAGFDDHLVKPVDVEILERLLAQAAGV